MTPDALTTFDFEEHAVRVIQRDGEPWFVAADVCRVLEIVNARDAVSSLDEDERDLVNLNTVGIGDGIRGNPNVNIISESGLYALVFTSRKPEAKRFRKWVTSVVLPSIRKHGFYMRTPGHDRDDALDEITQRDAGHWLSMVREARLLRGRAAAIRLWEKSPLPPLDGDERPEKQGAGCPVVRFIRECCTITGDPDDRVLARDLIAAYGHWARGVGAPPLPERSVALRLRAASERLGFAALKSGISHYTGLVLHPA